METSLHDESTALSQTWRSSKTSIKLSDTAVVINLCISTKYITLSLDDKTIRVFSTSGEVLHTLGDSQQNVWSLAVKDDTLLSGETSGEMRSWNLSTGYV